MKIFLWKDFEYEFIICSAETKKEAIKKITKKYGKSDPPHHKIRWGASLKENLQLDEPIILEGDFCEMFDHANE